MKRHKMVARLKEAVLRTEAMAEETAGYGFYADAAGWYSEAQGLRLALSLLDPDGLALPEGSRYWHHHYPDGWR